MPGNHIIIRNRRGSLWTATYMELYVLTVFKLDHKELSQFISVHYCFNNPNYEQVHCSNVTRSGASFAHPHLLLSRKGRQFTHKCMVHCNYTIMYCIIIYFHDQTNLPSQELVTRLTSSLPPLIKKDTENLIVSLHEAGIDNCSSQTELNCFATYTRQCVSIYLDLALAYPAFLTVVSSIPIVLYRTRTAVYC